MNFALRYRSCATARRRRCGRRPRLRRGRTWWRAARESTESREQRARPNHEFGAEIEEQERRRAHADPRARVRFASDRAALRRETRGAVPDTVPLRRALLTERLRTRHADGIRRPLRVKDAELGLGHGIRGRSVAAGELARGYSAGDALIPSRTDGER